MPTETQALLHEKRKDMLASSRGGDGHGTGGWFKGGPRDGAVTHDQVVGCIKAMVVDVVASFVVFFLTAVIYVSGAQSIMGPYFDARLTFVALETMFAGTALTGIFFGLASAVPWATAAMDVGYLPLLVHLAEICYHGTVVDARVDRRDGDDARASDVAGTFAATFVVSQAVMFVCVGVALWSLGTLRWTRLSNYLPYPVTAGLLASIGVSLAKSGLKVAAKVGFRDAGVDVGLLWLLCCVGLAGASAVLKHTAKLPGYVVTPAVVVVGSLGLVVGAAAADVDREDLKTKYGALFDYDTTAPNGFFLYTGVTGGGASPMITLGRVQWTVVGDGRAVYVAAVVIGALKLGIKASSFVNMFPMVDIDVDEEMRFSGLTNIIAGILGSTGQAHSFSGIKVQQQLEASTKRAAILVPLWCFVAWIRGVGALLSAVPRFVFGALLVELGVDYIDAYLCYPLRGMIFGTMSNLDIVDAATLVIIVIAGLISNLLAAVALGLVFSLIGVSRRLAQRSIVAQTTTGKYVRSTIERPPRAMRILDDSADAVVVLDLMGYIFFGSAQELVDLVVHRVKDKTLPRLGHLVIDLSRCFPQFDVTAVAAFEKILALAKARGFHVHLAPKDSDPCLALRNGLRACGTAGTLFDDYGLFFDTVDDALEHCEDTLLAAEALRATTPTPPPTTGNASKLSPTDSGSTIYGSPKAMGLGRLASLDMPDEDNDVGIEIDHDDDDVVVGGGNSKDHGGGAFASLSHHSSEILKRKDLIRAWLVASAVPLEALFPRRRHSYDDGDDAVLVGVGPTTAAEASLPSHHPPVSRRSQRISVPGRKAHDADERDVDTFVDALADKVAISHGIEFQDDDNNKQFTLLVHGRARLNNNAGNCIRKLADGSAVGVGDYYALDDSIDDVSSSQQFTLIQASRHITALHLKYDDLRHLEIHQPEIAIQWHKIMARSLAQKNRNSKLQRRSMEY